GSSARSGGRPAGRWRLRPAPPPGAARAPWPPPRRTARPRAGPRTAVSRGRRTGVAGGSPSMRAMELAEWCSSSRVIIVAGKGGVGKTTTAATLAVAAARAGRRTLLVELEGKSGLASMFGLESLSGQYQVEPGLTILPLAADEALLEYLEDHGLRRMSKRLVQTGVLDIVATAVPGMKEILVLGRAKALQREGLYDVIVVDGPAAGHAVTFLLSPKGLLDAVRVGPVLTQAVEVSEMLADPERAQVMLVTLPEETPVNETVETAETLVDRIGLTLGPLVVNGLYPDRPLDHATSP